MKTVFTSKVLMASVAVCALTFGFGISHVSPFGATAALAQESGQGGSGGQGSQGGKGGQGGKSGQGQGQGQGGASQGTPGKGLSGHVFEEDEGPSEEAKGPQHSGGKATTGKPGTAGTKKGEDLGDLWVILRDQNGGPDLNTDRFDHPGDNLIPLDAEGAPIEARLVQEVALRLSNVGRALTKVLDKSLDDAVKAINDADSVSIDDSGRLVVTKDGVASTIDSPTENLALYKTLMTTGTIPGITDPAKLASLSYLVDGAKTVDDLKAATGFLAGSTDKTAPLSIDEIVYLNQILGIPGTITGPDGKTYVDFSTFAYDRQKVYGDMTAEVLIQTSPGVYEAKTVNLYDSVFSGTQDTGSGVDGFTQAADDARSILLYLHDNAPR